MIIEHSDFRLTNDGMSTCWDLEVMRTVRPRGKPEREEWSDPLYGMPLDRAIKIIINYRLNKRKDVYTLQEYLHQYKDELNKLNEILKNYGNEEKFSSDD